MFPYMIFFYEFFSFFFQNGLCRFCFVGFFLKSTVDCYNVFPHSFCFVTVFPHMFFFKIIFVELFLILSWLIITIVDFPICFFFYFFCFFSKIVFFFFFPFFYVFCSELFLLILFFLIWSWLKI